MIILDTDVLSIIQLGSGVEYEHLGQRLAGFAEHEPAVSIVTFEEQSRGWLAQINKARQPEQLVRAYRRFRALLDDFTRWRVLDFTEDVAAIYANLGHSYRRHGSIDLRIASIAMANDAILISRNSGGFSSIATLRFEAF